MKTINNNNNIESKKNVVVAENEVSEESRKAYGEPSVNEAMGWKLDHVIQFDFWFNAYIKSRMSLEEITRIVASGIGIRHDDTSKWAEDIRTIIRFSIKKYDKDLDDKESYEGADDLNETISCQRIGDAIEDAGEAAICAAILRKLDEVA